MQISFIPYTLHIRGYNTINRYKSENEFFPVYLRTVHMFNRLHSVGLSSNEIFRK